MALNKEISDSESESGKSESVQVVPAGPNLPGAVEKGAKEKGAKEKEAETWEVAVTKADAATKAWQENQIQEDKEAPEKFKQDQARAVQETAQQFQQESKEEEFKKKAKAEWIRVFE